MRNEKDWLTKVRVKHPFYLIPLLCCAEKFSQSTFITKRRDFTYMTCIKWLYWSQMGVHHYRCKLMRGSGGRALSTGYRSLTAILTSSTSAVRNRSRFRMVYSWSARMTLPWRRTWVDRLDANFQLYKLAVDTFCCSPGHTVQQSSGRQLHLNQTGCRRSCRSPAA